MTTEFSSPPRTPKKKANARAGSSSSGGNRSIACMSPTFTPNGWEAKRVVLVYHKPKDDAKVANVPGRDQGVWAEGYVAASNPQEVWVFDHENAPPNLDAPLSPMKGATGSGGGGGLSSSSPKKKPTGGNHHIHGIWGYKPGGDPEDPNDVWFYPPDYGDGSGDGRSSSNNNKPLPRYFTPRGVWTFPLIKRNASEIAPEATGWLGLGQTAKMEKLDVAGTWKMMYKQDGLDDEVKGPGMKSPKKSPKKSPTRKTRSFQISVETPEGKRILMSVLPTDTVATVKDKVLLAEGMTKVDQRFLPLSPKGEASLSGELPDHQTLKDCGVENGDTLRLQDMHVCVQNHFDPSLTPRFFVDVINDQTTVSILKDKIFKQEGIAVEDQLLSFDKQLLGDNDSMLRDYRIRHGDTLQLDNWEVTVYDTIARTEFVVAIHPRCTVSDLQDKVAQEGIPLDYVNLSYRGKSLDQPRRTLKEYQISHRARLELRPLTLIVQPPRGKSPIRLTKLSPSSTLRTVKDDVANQTGMSADEQRLLLEGQPLQNDKKTLRDFQIHNGDVLHLEGMELHVQHWNGKKKYKLDDLDSSTDTLADVKDMLQDRYNIRKEHQRLSYNGKQLERDDRRLAAYGIKHQAILKLEPSQIEVVTTDGESIPVEVDLEKYTLNIVRQKVAERLDIPVHEQRFLFEGEPLADKRDTKAALVDYGIVHGSALHLQDMIIFVENAGTGSKFSILVDPVETIENVQEMIALHHDGLPKKFQNLIFQGKHLDVDAVGESSLRNCNLKHHDVLVLGKIEIAVRMPDGRKVPIKVSPTATLADVKEEIEDVEMIPADDQRLASTNGRVLDKHATTLQEYNIPHGSTILMQPMEIKVETIDGNVTLVTVSPTDTILFTKEKVEQKIGIPVADQDLLWNGMELKDAKTLSEYGIKHGSTLNIIGMQIYVHHYNGNILTLPVATTTTLKDVKGMIRDSENLPLEEQNVVFGGSLLVDNSRTLGEYKIKHGSTLKLEQMKIYVQTPTRKFPLTVEPALTVLGLKDKIQKKAGIAPTDQNIQFHGDDLEDPKATLTQCHIKHQDTLQVEVKNQPTYKVSLGDYQSAFEYHPSPKKKREGVRERKTYNALGDFRATVPTSEIVHFEHRTIEAPEE